MRCPQCRFENRDDRLKCEQCGALLDLSWEASDDGQPRRPKRSRGVASPPSTRRRRTAPAQGGDRARSDLPPFDLPGARTAKQPSVRAPQTASTEIDPRPDRAIERDFTSPWSKKEGGALSQAPSRRPPPIKTIANPVAPTPLELQDGDSHTEQIPIDSLLEKVRGNAVQKRAQPWDEVIAQASPDVLEKWGTTPEAEAETRVGVKAVDIDAAGTGTDLRPKPAVSASKRRLEPATHGNARPAEPRDAPSRAGTEPADHEPAADFGGMATMNIDGERDPDVRAALDALHNQNLPPPEPLSLGADDPVRPVELSGSVERTMALPWAPGDELPEIEVELDSVDQPAMRRIPQVDSDRLLNVAVSLAGGVSREALTGDLIDETAPPPKPSARRSGTMPGILLEDVVEEPPDELTGLAMKDELAGLPPDRDNTLPPLRAQRMQSPSRDDTAPPKGPLPGFEAPIPLDRPKRGAPPPSVDETAEPWRLGPEVEPPEVEVAAAPLPVAPSAAFEPEPRVPSSVIEPRPQTSPPSSGGIASEATQANVDLEEYMEPIGLPQIESVIEPMPIRSDAADALFETPGDEEEMELRLQSGGLLTRSIATFIDAALVLGLLQGLALVGVFGDKLQTFPIELDGYAASVSSGDFIFVIIAFVLVIFSMSTLEHGVLGRSFGKLLTGLRVVDTKTGDKPAMPKAVVRALLSIVSAAFGGFGYFWILVDRESRALHDILCRTAVVRGKGELIEPRGT